MAELLFVDSLLTWQQWPGLGQAAARVIISVSHMVDKAHALGSSAYMRVRSGDIPVRASI